MGSAHLVGDNVDTDQIIPGKFLTTTDPTVLAEHCMENLDPEFADQFVTGDIIVAGENFGSGSSREHAPLAIRALGAEAVVAESFARIFFRNAINIGVPVVTVSGITDSVDDGDELTLDLAAGSLRNERTGRTFETKSQPEFIQEIIDAGGLIAYGQTLSAAENPR